VTISPGCARVQAKGTSTIPERGRTAAVREDNDLIFWLPSLDAIVTGDSLSDFGHGLDIQLGGRKHVTREAVANRLRPLLDLPIKLVLPAHGEPTNRAALEQLLS
jgi:glyoxylase-like metal-dependent hydrolase (beta-lactamase superfamily II)